MKRFLIAAAALLVGLTAGSQSTTSTSKETCSLTAGIELDALPYLSSGWYTSVWVGIPSCNLRIRPVVATSNIPSFMLSNDINKNRIKAYALIVDYFFNSNFEGFWLGTGLERWNAKVTAVNKQSRAYKQVVYTLGGGYVWKVWGNLYLNPWVAGHLSLSEDGRLTLGNTSFKPSRFTPEASLKLGWHF